MPVDQSAIMPPSRVVHAPPNYKRVPTPILCAIIAINFLSPVPFRHSKNTSTMIVQPCDSWIAIDNRDTLKYSEHQCDLGVLCELRATENLCFGVSGISLS